jgi:hypothetical protein
VETPFTIARNTHPDVNCPPDKAGNWLVWSNPRVEEYLANKGLLDDLKNKTIQEMPAAREAIENDAQNDDAIGWLHMWAWRLSRIP